MSDHAYDISHLLEIEPLPLRAREPRWIRPVPDKPAGPSLQELQQALSRELLQLAGAAHEEMIRCYRGMESET